MSTLPKASPISNFHYNKTLQPYANENRKSMTKSAAAMWKYVLGKRQMLGYQFRRERTILNYITDFVCLELMLIIEVDGISHELPHAGQRDVEREKVLRSVGFEIMRFSSQEVLTELVHISDRIADWIENNAKTPPPRKQRRGDKSSS